MRYRRLLGGAILCVSVVGMGPLAWAGEREMLDLQIQLLDQELAALHRQQAVIDHALAAPRESPRVNVPDYLSVAPPPMDLRPYELPPEEPQRSMRPPWLQPADQFSGWSSLSPADRRRLFCLAPNDCYLDERR